MKQFVSKAVGFKIYGKDAIIAYILLFWITDFEKEI